MSVELQDDLQAGLRTDASSEPAAALSVGAKVGIALSTIIAFALLVGARVIFCLRNRRRERQSLVLEDRTMPASELSGYSSGLRRLFLGRWRAEIDGRMQRAEMEAEKVYELPVPPAELEAPEHQQAQDPAPPCEARPYPDSAIKGGALSTSEAVEHVGGQPRQRRWPYVQAIAAIHCACATYIFKYVLGLDPQYKLAAYDNGNLFV